MNDLDLALNDMHAALKSARTDECALSWGRRIVQIKFDRGCYPISELGADLLEVMARALVKEIRK